MDFPCVACAREVRPRQHAVACDVCEGWQHRTCGTGINARQYKAAVRGNKDIPFVCCKCKNQKEQIDGKEDRNTSISSKVAPPTNISCRTPERVLPATVEDILQELVPLPTPEPLSQGSPAPLSTSITPEIDRTTTINRALFTSPPEPLLPHDTDRMNFNATRVIKIQTPEESDVEDQAASTNYDQGYTDVRKKSTLPFLGLSFNLDSDDDSSSKLDLNNDVFDLIDLINEKIEPMIYRVIKQGSLMGKDLLTDSIGYTYVIKSKSCRRTRWRCSVRTKYWTCRATVIQTGTTFTPGDEIHMHFPQIQKSKDAELIVKIRDKVENRRSTLKKSSRTIVQDSIDETDRLTPLSERKIQTLMRRTNNIRGKHRKHEACKENDKTRPCGSSCYLETTSPDDGPAKLQIQISRKPSQTKTGFPKPSVLQQIQKNDQIIKPTNNILHATTRTTLPAPQKRPQTLVPPTSNIVVPRNTLPTPKKRPQSTTQSTTNTMITRPTIAGQDNIPQPNMSTGYTIVKGTIPSSTGFPVLPSSRPPKSTTANNTELVPTATTTIQTQENKQVHSTTTTRTMPNDVTVPSLQHTHINQCEEQHIPVLPNNTATKKRKIDPLSMNERYQQLLKRPRYDRTARSIVEDSIRNQGYDPENPPPFINVDNLIRCVNRCRRKNLIAECERLMSERQGDVCKTLRPPTEIPMKADSDCLQGKEEDRYF